MGALRIKPSETVKKHLLDEVSGLCPFCGDTLLPTIDASARRSFEIPHIYPLNPKPYQIPHLQNCFIPGGDINSMENLLAACRKCHDNYDKYFTKNEFNKWLATKDRVKKNRDIKQFFSKYTIEDEIRVVIEKLIDIQNEENVSKLDYRALKIEQKLANSITFILKKTIENDVVDYFYLIQSIFKEIDKLHPGKFDLLSSQIKTFYLKCCESGHNKQRIYNYLVDWLNNKTSNTSTRACEIILSFFIQNCEVY